MQLLCKIKKNAGWSYLAMEPLYIKVLDREREIEEEPVERMEQSLVEKNNEKQMDERKKGWRCY